MKDQYKVYAEGEKVESGSWSDSPMVRKYKSVIMLVKLTGRADIIFLLHLR